MIRRTRKSVAKLPSAAAVVLPYCEMSQCRIPPSADAAVQSTRPSDAPGLNPDPPTWIAWKSSSPVFGEATTGSWRGAVPYPGPSAGGGTSPGGTTVVVGASVTVVVVCPPAGALVSPTSAAPSSATHDSSGAALPIRAPRVGGNVPGKA